MRSTINQARRKQLLLFGTILSIYYCLWAIANWPALSTAWWFIDDYVRMEDIYFDQTLDVRQNFRTGRPLEIPQLFLSFLIDGNPDHRIHNQVIRAIQGGMHVLATFTAGYLLWKKSKRWIVFAAMLPFLLWPFHSEAVLWRSAGAAYPFAAFESVLAIVLISKKKPLFGTVLIIIAVLTNQLAAMAGVVMWLLVQSLQMLSKSHEFEWKNTLYLISGYLGGGFVSFLIAKYVIPGDHLRNTLATDLVSKFNFLLELDRLSLTNTLFYPKWLTCLHVFLMTAAIVTTISFAYKRISIWKTLLILFCYLAIWITRYLPLLIVTESWPSLRAMYLSPLLSVSSMMILLQTLESGKRIAKICTLLLMILILISYTSIARQNSSEYVQVFKSDLSTLRRLGTIANEVGINQVCVPPPSEYTPNYNPYGLKYMHKESKLSAFIPSYSSSAFIHLFSSLRPTRKHSILKECINLCRTTKSDNPFLIQELEGLDTICMCPNGR